MIIENVFNGSIYDCAIKGASYALTGLLHKAT